MKHKNIKFQFYFIRHGESESNIESGMAYANDHNAPLTKRGHEQSLALGKRLKNSEITFDKIYSSTLTRAIETTTNMLKGMKLNYEKFEKFDHIIEQQIPGWRGKKFDEVMTPEIQLLSEQKGKWFQPADGESGRQVERRASNWLEDEFLDNPKWLDKKGIYNIAIISHGITLRCIFHYITGWDTKMMKSSYSQILNCSISRFNFGPLGWEIISFNDSYHTEKIGDIITDKLK